MHFWWQICFCTEVNIFYSLLDKCIEEINEVKLGILGITGMGTCCVHTLQVKSFGVKKFKLKSQEHYKACDVSFVGCDLFCQGIDREW